MGAWLDYAVVGTVIVGAAAFMLRTWRRPAATCRSCPKTAQPSHRLVQLRRRS